MSTELVTTSDLQLFNLREALIEAKTPEDRRELLNFAERLDSIHARKAFFSSVADFQARCPIIEKADKAYDKEYARLDRIWRTIRPLITELGLVVTWQTCEIKDGVCHLEGMLAQAKGHSIALRQDVPLPELIKGQNKAQQAASAQTYAKRYALCAALGIVTGDDSDDDGHMAGALLVTDEQAAELDTLVQAARGLNNFVEPAFWTYVGAESTNLIPADKYAPAKALLQRKLAAK
jgi:hypothetical protein